MSNTSQAPGTRGAAGVPRQRDMEVQQTGWVGWITFAGVMMIMVGSFQAMMGLVALFKSDYYVVTSSDLLVTVSYDSWGWAHLILGALVAATGFGVMAGQMWARVVGVALVALAALVNMAFLAAYPVWAVTLIALDVLVIYALVVHGREMKHLV
jgi:hypothetical protein